MKLILFTIVLIFFYFQIQKIDFKDFKKIKIVYVFPLISAIFLLFLNWFLEYLKWNEMIQIIQKELSVKMRVKSFLSGILSGFLTPNLLGNFIGRMYYFQRKDRQKIIYLTLYSNVAQFFSSIIFGLCSIMILGFPTQFKIESTIWMDLAFAFSVLVCFILFFKLHTVFSNLFQRKRYLLNISSISFGRAKFSEFFFQFKQMIFSLLRHFVFSFQYFLILISFGIKPDLNILFLIWQVFFWSTLVPSLWFGKLFIRESVALWILASYTHKPEIVLLSSLILWFVNQGVTALIAVPYFKFSTQHNV